MYIVYFSNTHTHTQTVANLLDFDGGTKADPAISTARDATLNEPQYSGRRLLAYLSTSRDRF